MLLRSVPLASPAGVLRLSFRSAFPVARIGSRSMSTSSTLSSSHAEPKPRWFYAREGDWTTFPPADDAALEARWRDLGGADWAAKVQKELEAEKKEREEEREEEEEEEDNEEEQVRKEKEDQQVKKKLDETSQSDTETARPQDKSSSWGPQFISRWWSGSEDQKLGVLNEDDAEKKRESTRNAPDSSKKDGPDAKPTMIDEVLDPDEPDSARRHKVEVLEDHLFDVDLRKMQLYPAFFRGVLLPVIRSTWFYWSEMKDQYVPIRWDSDLAKDLETAWKESRASELGQDKGEEGEDSAPQRKETDLLDVRSEEQSGKGKVKFVSPVEGKIFSEEFRGRMMTLVGGATVIRGFEEVERRAKLANGSHFFSLPNMPWESEQDDEAAVNEAAGTSGKAGAAQPDDGKTSAADETKGGSGAKSDSGSKKNHEEAKRTQKQKNTEEGTKPGKDIRGSDKKASSPSSELQKGSASKSDTDSKQTEANDVDESSEAEQVQETLDAEASVDTEALKDDPVHLILVIHGIGQGLTDTFESLDFTYDVQKIRKLSAKVAQEPTIRKLGKGRRVQYIPVCWRRDLDLTHESEENDNHFGLEDVTNDATIPFVRNLVSKVILDVPYYLSSIHKPKMVAAVLHELNRVYRLFVRRNPDFLEKGGKVSFISHSLGSCFTADILSSQPTTVQSIAQMSKEEIQEQSTKRLLFNVQDVFLVGSPLGLFLLLAGGQLIARKVPRNASIGEGSSLDLKGQSDKEEESEVRYGCMAFHGNLFNLYNASDPVAYRLNAAVDRRYARLLNPLPLPGAVNAIMDALKKPRVAISKLFDPKSPFKGSKSYKEAASAANAPKGDPSTAESSEESDMGRYAETMDDLPGFGEDANRRHKTAAYAIARALSSSEEEHSDVESAEEHQKRSKAAEPVQLEEGTQAKEALPERILAKEREEEERKRKKKAKKQKQKQDEQDKGEASKSLDLDHLIRAEKRFRALNRHGCIDFYFNTTPANTPAMMGEYISMLSAHNNYWNSPALVNLILTQVWAEEDVAAQEAGEARMEASKKRATERSKGGSELGARVSLVPSVAK